MLILVSEEGARFPMSMVSSGVWAGKVPVERAHAMKEVGKGGRTMKQELERIGYLGDIAASYKDSPIAVSPVYQCDCKVLNRPGTF